MPKKASLLETVRDIPWRSPMKRFLGTVLVLYLTAVCAYSIDIPRSTAKPAVTASGSLSWTYDIDTLSTGFENLSSFTMTFPLLDERSFTKKGKEVYGEIKVKDFSFSLDPLSGPDGDEAKMNNGSVASANFYFGPWNLAVFGAPTLSELGEQSFTDSGAPSLYISANKTVGGGEAPAIDMAAYTMGTALNFKSAIISGGATVLSAGTSRQNSENLYAYGGNLIATPSQFFNAKFGFAWVPYTMDYQVGAAIPLTLPLVLRGLVLTPAVDFSSIGEATAYDAGILATLRLSSLNIYQDTTKLSAALTYNADGASELSLAFAEPLEGGWSKDFRGGASFKLKAGRSWAVDTDLGYKIAFAPEDYLTVGFSSLFTRTGGRALYVTAEFGDTSYANTTFSINYVSGNLLADQPVIGFVMAKVLIEIE
jgi:hypothetical protein